MPLIKFLDGPAADVSLRLMRSPAVLRVVRSAGGTWDALDQPDDVAAAREQIHVYHLASVPRSMFIRCQPRSASGLYIDASYKHLILPDELRDGFRDNAVWSAWCDRKRQWIIELLPAAVRLQLEASAE